MTFPFGLLSFYKKEDSSCRFVAMMRRSKIAVSGCTIGILLLLQSARAVELVEDPATSGVLVVRDGKTDVLSYRFGDQLKPGVDPKYTRGGYIHPLKGLDGQLLTDDFPADHLHHHGMSWTWPVVKTRGVETQNWHPAVPPLDHKFVRWAERKTDNNGVATFTAENEWVLDKKEKVAREQVTMQVHPVKDASRVIDCEITLEAVGGPLTLQGTHADKKGYGGFNWRASPEFKGATITTDAGAKRKDVVHEPFRWVDLSTQNSGVAVFPAPSHPDFPPRWMARNSYAGIINVSWPGLKEVTLQPGKPISLKYRFFIHRGQADVSKVSAAYEEFVKSSSARRP